jgi:phage tail tube protein FII
MMILPVRQIHLPLIEEGVFFVGPLDKVKIPRITVKIPQKYQGNSSKKPLEIEQTLT